MLALTESPSVDTPSTYTSTTASGVLNGSAMYNPFHSEF